MSEPVLGLIAGSGRFPILVADGARHEGARVVALALAGEAPDVLAEHVERVYRVAPGQIGRMLRLLKQEGADRVIIAGGVHKTKMFSFLLPIRMRTDVKALAIWYRKLQDRRDHSILGSFAQEFEKEGIRVESSIRYVQEHMAGSGAMTRRAPTRREIEDIEFGWDIAKEVAKLQIGQTIVVKHKTVIAIEGIDGTDATLRRGGRLGRRGAVAIKLSKARQDERFDVPTVGVQTIRTLREAKIGTLALEAGKTLMLDKPDVIRAADQHKIALFGR